MHIVHLTASTFFGGPERQMLGLAGALSAGYRSTYLSFSENGRCAAFLEQVKADGRDAAALQHDTPSFRAAMRELAEYLSAHDADILITHGYKSNLLGRIAARRVGIPIIAVSRGWTGENMKVRVYERLDRFALRYMNAVVAVSEGQAEKVRQAGVAPKKLWAIRNAARLHAFRSPAFEFRERLRQLAGAGGNEKIVLAAGRLSPEKGFAVLVDAAAVVIKSGEKCRFVLFGEGVERRALEQRIHEAGLDGQFTLAGFRDDLDHWLPWADVVVLPSFTEGLPNVALEASAAGIPVVATAVGGTPEVVRDARTGFLVPSGNASSMAARILELCRDDDMRRRLGAAGKQLMQEQFSFEAQARAYEALFTRLVRHSVRLAA